MPVAGAGDYSPDGTKMVYSPRFRDFRPEKRYGGGQANDLCIFDLKTNDAKRIIAGPRADRDPMWIGNTIYFTSDTRRHVQHLRLRRRERQDNPGDEEHDLGRPLAELRPRRPDRLRAERRAPDPRHEDGQERGRRDHRARTTGCGNARRASLRPARWKTSS